MAQEGSARAGYFRGDQLELGLRYAYSPEFVPLFMDYLGARPHSRILEVGTGTAFLARLLARKLDGVQVTGLDTDANMFELAGDARIPLDDAISYTLARHKITWDWLTNLQGKHGDELAKAGFSQAEFEELMELKCARDDYLRVDPTRIREIMEVYTDALLIVQGTKPAAMEAAGG